jgi:hypothetical protein
MKKIRYILIMAVSALMLVSCEPAVLPTPDIGPAPTAADLEITITPGVDAFHFVIENTSKVTGMPAWDLGNGTTANGAKVVVYYPLPNTYVISMTLYTKGGNAKITKEIVTTETDWAYFSSPLIALITGGPEAVNGKTWVMDSLTPAHIGVGPNLDNSFQWWAAGVKEKPGTGLYDDELNFKLMQFQVTYDNKGISYVKDFRKGDSNYANARTKSGDWMVDYVTPVSGSWSYIEKDGKNYLKITSAKPIYPCFDTGAKDGEYLIMKVTETTMELACIGGDNNAWHYLLRTKGS